MKKGITYLKSRLSIAIKFLMVLLLTQTTHLDAWSETFMVGSVNYEILSETDLTCGVTKSKCGSTVEIPYSVTNPYTGKSYKVIQIGEESFVQRNITSITIANSVESIGAHAFKSCTGFESITIPNSVTSIGTHAFYYCRDLKTVDIPNSVTYIGDFAFAECTGITAFEIPSNISYFGNGVLSCCESLTSITIPSTISSIGDYAFNYCYNLSSINIPDNITHIGYRAFNQCISLTSVTIPNSVTSIDESAFSNCKNLSSFYGKFASVDHRCLIADGVLVGFAGYGLTSYVIPNTVTVIGENAFESWYELTSITIPNTVTSIGSYAFSICQQLTDITLPNSVTSVGKNAFSGCSSLKKPIYNSSIFVCLPGNTYSSYRIPDGIKEIAPAAFSSYSKLTQVSIPNSVTKIGENAFYNCSGLISITLPNAITSINDNTFYNCSSLTSIEIPNNLTSIGESAFGGCTNLTNITLPKNITNIGKSAFSSCKSLNWVKIMNPTPENITIGESVFNWSSSNCILYVPEGSKSLYEAIDAYSTFASIEEYEGDDPLSYSIISEEDATCEVIAMAENEKYSGNIKVPQTKTIDGKVYTVTAIADGAFSACPDLISVKLPEAIITIGMSNFYQCDNLVSVNLPESVQSIGDACFYLSPNLAGPIYNSTIFAYLGNSYSGAYSIPNGITTISNYAFCSCSGLTSIEIPNTVTTIGHLAFQDCTNLAHVALPESVRYIDDLAFWRCTGITEPIFNSRFFVKLPTSYAGEYNVPDGISKIVGYAFHECRDLTSITIPQSVSNFGLYAFASFNIRSITINNPNPSTIAFEDPSSLGYSLESCTLYVPQGSRNAYVADGRWDRFSSIKEDPLGYSIISEDEATCMLWTTSPESCMGDIVVPATKIINSKTYTVTAIADRAFCGCQDLISVYLPETLKTIGESNFYQCDNLVSVNLPESVEEVGTASFYASPKLTSTIYNSKIFAHLPQSYSGHYSIQSGITKIINFAFAGCNELTSVDIPNTVTKIGSLAFQGCENLERVSFPESVTEIEGLSFWGCSGLTEPIYNSHMFVKLPTSHEGLYSVPEGTSTIIAYAFHECDALTSITVPSSIRSLEIYAFASPNIESITIQNPNPSSISVFEADSSFELLNSCTLYVPKGSKALYEADGRWKAFASIEEYTEKPDYEFTAEDITARKGRITMLPVSMNNVGGIISFQCDISLPEGVSVHQENGTYAFEKSDRFDGTHSLSSALQTDGKIRVISYSSANHAYAGNDGVLFSIPVEVSEDLTDDSEVTLSISNIKLSIGETMKSYTPKDVNTKITVARKYTPGDVNDDGEFTILDASMVIAYVLGRDPLNGIKEAADVNEDGEITVLDASIVVSYVLNGRPVNGAAKANALVKNTQASEQAAIRFEDGKAYVSIPDASRFVAGQLALSLPEGTQIASISLVGENADNHSLAWQRGDHGVINVATYSLSNLCLSGEDLIEIAFAHNYHAGEIAVSNILMTSMDNDYYEEMAFAPTYATIGTDGITDTTDELIIYAEVHNLVVISPTETTLTIASVDGKWHTLDVNTGKNTYPLNPGFYLVNNHKILIK